MPNLPQRPASHVNSQRSERAFYALFPNDKWVIRPINPDYGRDLEVELFENGETTGILFGVQLKSLNKAPRKDGRVSKSGIEASSVRYWQSLDYPFMVATYSVPANQFFTRWAHSFDWHQNSHAAVCTEECQHGPKTVTFKYKPIHQLTPEVIAKLPEQLRFFREARTGDLRRRAMPVRVDGQPIDGHSLARITNELGQIAANFGQIELAESSELAVRLTYSRSEIRAVLPGDMRSATLHTLPGVYDDAQGPVALAADGLVLLAHLFFGLKADDSAANLIATAVPYSRALFDTDGAPLLQQRLEEAGRLDVIDVLAAEERRRIRRAVGPIYPTSP